MSKRSFSNRLAVILLASGLLVGGTARTASAAERPVTATAGDAGLDWLPCPPLFPKGCEIAVLHGDPAAPNADVFLRIPPKAEIPPHTHTSAERMILVSGELSLEYTGHRPSVLKVGSYAYGPAKLPHKATCSAAGPCVLFIAFESPVDIVEAEAPKKK